MTDNERQLRPLDPEEVKRELRELTDLTGLHLKEEIFDVLVELTRLDVHPSATTQVLKSLCHQKANRPNTTGQ